jgi:hypothetical protein
MLRVGNAKGRLKENAVVNYEQELRATAMRCDS